MPKSVGAILTILVLGISQFAAAETEEVCFDPSHPPASYISTYKQEVADISLTKNAQITLWSDVHNEAFNSDLLRKNLPKLKSEGVSVLLMEMLPMGFSVSQDNPMSQSTIRAALDEKIKGQWPTKHFENLIQAAVSQGFTVEGFSPEDTDQEYDAPEMQELRKKRDHYNVSDQFYTLNVMKVLKKYPRAKFVIQVGFAHTNGFYEKGDYLTNRRMFGELLYQGFQREDLRILLVNKKFFANYFVELPQGQRPGCSQYEAWSAYDGIIFGW